MSAQVSARPKAASFNLREQMNVLNLHWAGVGLLALVNLYLLVHLGILWQTAKNQGPEAQARQRIALQSAVAAAKPLEGLDMKLLRANEEANTFYAERLPVSYSEIATQLGELSKEHSVRLTRVQYAQQPVADVSVGQLTEIKMDAGLSGDYHGLVEFINGLERDKVFFVINGVTLTGQESGRVNLRMKMTSYMRGLSSDEEAERASTPVAVSLADQVDSQASALSERTGGRR